MGLGGREGSAIKAELSVYMNSYTTSVKDFSPFELHCPDMQNEGDYASLLKDVPEHQGCV